MANWIVSEKESMNAQELLCRAVSKSVVPAIVYAMVELHLDPKRFLVEHKIRLPLLYPI